MNDKLKKVAEFHETFDHPIGSITGETVAPEAREIRKLRLKLLFEELAELAEASDCRRTMAELSIAYVGQLMVKLGTFKQDEFEAEMEQVRKDFDEEGIPEDGDNVNKLEELDALCDLEYVLMGKVLTAGLQDVFDKNFDIVHENNMTKAHTGPVHVEETVRSKGDSRLDYTTSQKGDKWLLFNKDGKLTKPHDHLKVKLTLE